MYVAIKTFYVDLTPSHCIDLHRRVVIRHISQRANSDGQAGSCNSSPNDATPQRDLTDVLTSYIDPPYV